MSIYKKITIVVVTYNSENQIQKLLLSLHLINKIIGEIIIVDNNSRNFDRKKIENLNNKIKIIQNKQNLGFAKAVNQGIKKSKKNFILLLNPDTYLINNSISKTFNLIKKNKKIGVVGGQIKYPNNNLYPTANSRPTFLTGLFEFTNLKKIFPKNKYSKNFWIENIKKINKPIRVSSLCGAYLIFRRKINNKLNLFNEDFFMYMEDIDFGIKNNKEGYEVIFDPNSEIIHIGGASSKNRYKTALKYWYRSRKIFFKKNLEPPKGIILSLLFTLEEVVLKIYHCIKNEPYE